MAKRKRPKADSLSAMPIGTCVCRTNPRTKHRVQICRVAEKKYRNGLKITGRC